MSTSRSIYVSADAAESEVRSAVDAWLKSAGRDDAVNVEFGDEYPGFVTAVDLYGDDDDSAERFARTLLAALREQLPGARLELDVDLEAL